MRIKGEVKNVGNKESDNYFTCQNLNIHFLVKLKV